MSGQRFRHRRSMQDVKHNTLSRHNKTRHADKNRHVSPRHPVRTPPSFLEFFTNPLEFFTNPAERWWVVGIITITLAGELFDIFFLPNKIFGLNSVGVSTLVFFTLGVLLRSLVKGMRTTYYSGRSLFWWGVAVLVASVVGAIPGFIFIPARGFVAFGAFFGACLGCVVLFLPIVLLQAFINDPVEFLRRLFPKGFLRRFL